MVREKEAFYLQCAHQMLSFMIYDKHKISLGVYLGNDILKFLSLCGMRIIYEIILSIYDICTAGECSLMHNE